MPAVAHKDGSKFVIVAAELVADHMLLAVGYAGGDMMMTMMMPVIMIVMMIRMMLVVMLLMLTTIIAVPIIMIFCWFVAVTVSRPLPFRPE